MENMPSEMLLSIINMKLRDNYSSLEELCDDLDYSIKLVNEKLNSIGYYYDADLNQFKSK